MTLYQLECFVQVAEQLSFVRAAEKMCISQPAITYQIRSLEKEMGVVLFERNTRHCRLTMAGQTFYYDAVQLLSFSQHAVKKAQDIHNTNKSHFRVGIRKLSDYDLLAQFVEKFYEEHPASEIEILSQNDLKPFDDLRTNRIDIGFFFNSEHRNCTDISFEPLYKMNYYVLMAKNHPLSKCEALTISELKHLPIITAGADETYLSSVQEPAISELINAGVPLNFPASSFEGAMIAVRSGKGMLIMPMLESSQVQGMHKVPLLGCPPLQVEIGWMTQDTRREIPKFVEIAKKIYC